MREAVLSGGIIITSFFAAGSPDHVCAASIDVLARFISGPIYKPYMHRATKCGAGTALLLWDWMKYVL